MKTKLPKTVYKTHCCNHASRQTFPLWIVMWFTSREVLKSFKQQWFGENDAHLETDTDGLPWWLRQYSLPATQETQGQSLGGENPLEKGMAGCNPWDHKSRTQFGN